MRLAQIHVGFVDVYNSEKKLDKDRFRKDLGRYHTGLSPKLLED